MCARARAHHGGVRVSSERKGNCQKLIPGNVQVMTNVNCHHPDFRLTGAICPSPADSARGGGGAPAYCLYLLFYLGQLGRGSASCECPVSRFFAPVASLRPASQRGRKRSNERYGWA